MAPSHLLVSNLPDATEGELRALFEEFGAVQSIKLLPRQGDQMSALVDFEDADGAVQAMARPLAWKGRTLHLEVNPAKKRDFRLEVSNVPEEVSLKEVRTKFERFGVVEQLRLQQSATGATLFVVHFGNEEAAVNAKSALENTACFGGDMLVQMRLLGRGSSVHRRPLEDDSHGDGGAGGAGSSGGAEAGSVGTGVGSENKMDDSHSGVSGSTSKRLRQDVERHEDEQHAAHSEPLTDSGRGEQNSSQGGASVASSGGGGDHATGGAHRLGPSAAAEPMQVVSRALEESGRVTPLEYDDRSADADQGAGTIFGNTRGDDNNDGGHGSRHGGNNAGGGDGDRGHVAHEDAEEKQSSGSRDALDEEDSRRSRYIDEDISHDALEAENELEYATAHDDYQQFADGDGDGDDKDHANDGNGNDIGDDGARQAGAGAGAGTGSNDQDHDSLKEPEATFSGEDDPNARGETSGGPDDGNQERGNDRSKRSAGENANSGGPGATETTTSGSSGSRSKGSRDNAGVSASGSRSGEPLSGSTRSGGAGDSKSRANGAAGKGGSVGRGDGGSRAVGDAAVGSPRAGAGSGADAGADGASASGQLPNRSRTLFVKNFPPSASDHEVRNELLRLFNSVGQVETITLTGRLQGRHAFIDFPTDDMAASARDACDRRIVLGKQLYVGFRHGTRVPPQQQQQEQQQKREAGASVGLKGAAPSASREATTSADRSPSVSARGDIDLRATLTRDRWEGGANSPADRPGGRLADRLGERVVSGSRVPARLSERLGDRLGSKAAEERRASTGTSVAAATVGSSEGLRRFSSSEDLRQVANLTSTEVARHQSSSASGTPRIVGTGGVADVRRSESMDSTLALRRESGEFVRQPSYPREDRRDSPRETILDGRGRKDFSNWRNWESGGSRNLFVANLDKQVHNLPSILRDLFRPFGIVDGVEVKTPRDDTAYAFVLFERIAHAAAAKDAMTGHAIGRLCIRIDWGKPVPSDSVWVHGFASPPKEDDVRNFGDCGPLESVQFLGDDGLYLRFRTIEDTVRVVQQFNKMPIRGTDKLLMVEYADPPAKAAPRRSPSPVRRRASPDRRGYPPLPARRNSPPPAAAPVQRRAASPPPAGISRRRSLSPVRGGSAGMGPGGPPRSRSPPRGMGTRSPPLRRVVSPIPTGPPMSRRPPSPPPSRRPLSPPPSRRPPSPPPRRMGSPPPGLGRRDMMGGGGGGGPSHTFRPQGRPQGRGGYSNQNSYPNMRRGPSPPPNRRRSPPPHAMSQQAFHHQQQHQRDMGMGDWRARSPPPQGDRFRGPPPGRYGPREPGNMEPGMMPSAHMYMREPHERMDRRDHRDRQQHEQMHQQQHQQQQQQQQHQLEHLHHQAQPHPHPGHQHMHHEHEQQLLQQQQEQDQQQLLQQQQQQQQQQQLQLQQMQPPPSMSSGPVQAISAPLPVHAGDMHNEGGRYAAPIRVEDLRLVKRVRMTLKSLPVDVDLHLVGGNEALLQCMPAFPEAMEIKQRMRLDQLDAKFEEQYNTCILLGCAGNPADTTIEQHVVTYLHSKGALGLFTTPDVTVHIFPPCAFAERRLAALLPQLDVAAAMRKCLLIILVPQVLPAF